MLVHSQKNHFVIFRTEDATASFCVPQGRRPINDILDSETTERGLPCSLFVYIHKADGGRFYAANILDTSRQRRPYFTNTKSVRTVSGSSCILITRQLFSVLLTLQLSPGLRRIVGTALSQGECTVLLAANHQQAHSDSSGDGGR
ncbi:MAG: hypothetical protein ABR985_00555 [Methanotrichaceae archaeon]